MKSDREPGPFLKTEFIPDKRIERMALEELKHLGLLPEKPEPVRVDLICDMKWGHPEDYEEMDEGVLGCASFTIKGFDRIVISKALDADTSLTGRRRVRSTTAHEIGHAILHEKHFVEKMMMERDQMLLFGDLERHAKPPSAKRIICREADVFGKAGHKSPWYEIQANKFMAALLLPEPLLYEVVEPFLLEYDPHTAKPPQRIRYYAKIEEVSETFNVSREMARIAVEGYMAKDRAKRVGGVLI